MRSRYDKVDGLTSYGSQVLLLVSISVIIGVISMLSLGIVLLINGATYGKIGKTGEKGDRGDTGFCNLSNDTQLFFGGNITLSNNLIFNGSNGIVFDIDNSSSLFLDGDCLKINSNKSLCLNVSSFESGNGNGTIFINSTLCFDKECNIGITSYNDSNGNVFLYLFGPTLLQNLTIPLLIGDNGGYLDQLPGSGFLIASNPNSTGGIRIDSHEYGIYGNETFNDFISFINYIVLSGIKIFKNISSPSTPITLFDLSFIENNFLIMSSNSSEPFIIQSNTSNLLLSSPTSNVSLDTPNTFIINSPKLLLNNTYIYNSNLSFDLSSQSNQIGFFNFIGGPLNGKITSNITCPISIEPKLCAQNIVVQLLNFSNGGNIIGNGPLNISTPSVYIKNLSTDTFTVLGYTSFPAGISSGVGIIVFGGPSVFSGGIVVDALDVANFLTTDTLYVTGTSTFYNNVTFNGQSATCVQPIFTNVGSSSCVPTCLSFYYCINISAISFYARNGLRVADDDKNLFNSSSLNIILFGSGIDFIRKIYSSGLSTYEQYSNYSKTRAGIDIEITSGQTIDIYAFNRSSISTIKNINGTFYGLNTSCLPLISVFNNASGTPVLVTLNPPYYNYSQSTCDFVNEYYQYSNHTTSKNNIFMGSTNIKRTCTSTNNKSICTPYFDSITKKFPLSELLLNPSKSITLYNTSLSPEAALDYQYFIKNISVLYPNLTITSLSNLQLASLFNIITEIDTFESYNYSYIDLNGDNGEIILNSSNSIHVGPVNVDPINGDIFIPGSIFDLDGNDHPCCGGASLTTKLAKLQLNTPLVITKSAASSGSFLLNFSLSTSSGSLPSWNNNNVIFTATTPGLYQFEASLLVSSFVNITNIGCLYDVSSSLNVHQYYRFGSTFSSILNLPDDSTFKYLECNSLTFNLLNQENIQLLLYTQNPFTNVQPDSLTLTINTNSFVMVTKI